MQKTRVDDMLIEMISPKVKEIEEKFGQGIGLTQEDINTLLLKSQYNHINHLDDKLDEVTASVVALEGKFQGLEHKFQGLEHKFQGLEGKFQGLEGKFNTFKAEIIAELEKRIGGLETKMSGFEAKMESKIGSLETKFEQAQVKMQQTIITTMKWYIGGAGIVLVLLKALDIFVK
ncbi:MAG TPA: hypothetical protein PLV58_01340 [Campylobacterales bacterium]|nr:hypothetical protein [Campylobacterales bacterium]